MPSIFTPEGDMMAGCVVQWGEGELYKDKAFPALKRPYKARKITPSPYAWLGNVAPWRAFSTLAAAQNYLTKKGE